MVNVEEGKRTRNRGEVFSLACIARLEPSEETSSWS